MALPLVPTFLAACALRIMATAARNICVVTNPPGRGLGPFAVVGPFRCRHSDTAIEVGLCASGGEPAQRNPGQTCAKVSVQNEACPKVAAVSR